MARCEERLHPWDLSAADAVALQRQFCAEVRVGEPPAGGVGAIRLVAGADISFDQGDETIYAGIVVLRLPGLETVEEVGVVSRARFPYVPGLLSFREAPAVLEAWAKLRCEPDAAVFDGQGIAHPRRFGLASHVGLWIGRPAWGCAKSRFVGRYDAAGLGAARGSRAALVDRGETIGAVLRTKDRTNPVFVSAGHRIDLETAVELSLRLDGGLRVPEPTRRAHLFVNAMRRQRGAPAPTADDDRGSGAARQGSLDL